MRDLLWEILGEALEEVGLANAIREGRQNAYVPEDQIMALLEEET